MEGLKKGKIEGKIEIALEMIREGESNDKIRKYTGLTDDEVEKLRGEAELLPPIARLIYESNQ